MQIKAIDTHYSVSDQVNASDMSLLAAQGFRAVVNFRPDGEGGEAQPASATLAAQAAELGLAYLHIPVVPNQLQPQDVAQLQQFLQQHPVGVLGFCRTGNRASQAYQAVQQSQRPPAAAGACQQCCQASAQPTSWFGRLLHRLRHWSQR